MGLPENLVSSGIVVQNASCLCDTRIEENMTIGRKCRVSWTFNFQVRFESHNIL